MRKVVERVSFPPTGQSFLQWATAIGQQLSQTLQEYGHRLNNTLPKDGSETLTAPLPLKSYTTAERPSASEHEGAIIYVSDASAGSNFQGSDGSSWVSLG